MTQEGTVLRKTPGGDAVVEIVRQSSCGGDCSNCKGCAHPQQTLEVTVSDPVGAKPGDTVFDVRITAPTGKVYRSASVVYILPVILMFVFYFVPSGGEGIKILCSLLGLALGVGISAVYSRRASASGSLKSSISDILN